MNPIVNQQAALDNALVPFKKRLKIERCNARIAFSKPQKEETYQVTLDALNLSPCYPTFLITAEVPEIYMHQFWNTIKKIGKTNDYNFKLDKKKCRVDTEVFREILQICPRILNQDFMELPLEDDLLTLIKELGASLENQQDLIGSGNHFNKKRAHAIYGAVIPDGMVNDDIKISKAYKTYLAYATEKVPPKKARKFKKPASPKLKTTKATAKSDRGKGIELLLDVALLEDAQLKETMRKSKQETHKLQARGSSEGADFKSEVPDEQTGMTKDTSKGTGMKPGILDVSKEDSSDSDDDSWGDSKDESDDVHDEKDNDDDDGNDYDSGNDDGGDYEEEEQDEDNVLTPEKDKSDDEDVYEEEDDNVAKELYGDLNITQGLKDVDMTNVEQGRADPQNASHESGFVQKEEDAHVTLTTVHDKTKGSFQSSSISFDFTSKLLNLDDP
nr:hypothetical protein [Tanacetum cinerariifolium]